MGFLAPTFLIGFLALAVPIIIHIWSKNTQKSKPFGSLRFLTETETKTMRSVMPSQWLLLITRLLVLTCLVFILAQVFWKGDRKRNETLYLVDTAYQGTEFLKAIQDTISAESEMRWLAKGFPSTKHSTRKQVGDYWKLLVKPPWPAENTIVVSPLLMKNFASARKAFPVKYTWLKPPINLETEELLRYQKAAQSWVINTTFDEWKTSHTHQATERAEPIILSYYLKTAEGVELYHELFEAAIATLKSLSPLTINRVSEVESADWIIWLTLEEPPNRKNMISLSDESISKWKEITKGVIQISSDWSKSDAIQLNLPKKLLIAFGEGLADINEWDKRTMDPNAFTYTLEKAYDESELSSQAGINSLWLSMILLLICERWLAYKSEKP